MKPPVIFDVDGTLLDSVDLHAQAWSDALREFGIDVSPARVRSQIGKGGDQLMPVFLSPEQIRSFGEKLSHRRGEIWKERYTDRVRPFPAVRPLFQAIAAQGRRIALASSAKAEELEKFKKLLDIEEFLHSETSSADASKSKPHPDIFQAALDKLGVERGIVVGDSPYDAIAASRLGLRCIGVLCGGFERKELEDAGCDLIYRDPAALLGNLETWLGQEKAA